MQWIVRDAQGLTVGFIIHPLNAAHLAGSTKGTARTGEFARTKK
jgi:hypothetical protein